MTILRDPKDGRAGRGRGRIVRALMAVNQPVSST